MKALSIRQPWLWAILHAGKRVENRSRSDGAMPQCCSHRGKLLLHASGSMTRKEYDAASISMVAAHLATWDTDPGMQALKPRPVMPFMRCFRPGKNLGGIIGICDVIGHLTPHGWLVVSHGVRHAVRDDERTQLVIPSCSSPIDLRWWSGSYALVLDNVRPLPFVSCKGSRGLWDVPRDVLEKCCG